MAEFYRKKKKRDLLKNGGGVKFMEKLNVAIADSY